MAWRQRWKLTAQEVDSVLKRWRKTLDEKDPQTLHWFASDPLARREFLVRSSSPRRYVTWMTIARSSASSNELRVCGDEGEEPSSS